MRDARQCYVNWEFCFCQTEPTRRVEVSYEEIATVAALPRNDTLIFDI